MTKSTNDAQEQAESGGRTSPDPVPPQSTEAADKSPEIRYASDAEFTKAHRKTGTVHAGLFRRLAE